MESVSFSYTGCQILFYAFCIPFQTKMGSGQKHVIKLCSNLKGDVTQWSIIHLIMHRDGCSGLIADMNVTLAKSVSKTLNIFLLYESHPECQLVILDLHYHALSTPVSRSSWPFKYHFILSVHTLENPENASLVFRKEERKKEEQNNWC